MAGYTRQSTFADGDTITAALFNNEYNQLVNAFSNTSGHKHDGTAAEGPVIGLIGDAGETTPLNKVLIDTVNNYIEFYVDVSSSSVQQLYIADGAIVPVTDNDIDLGTSSLEFKNLYLDGTAKIDILTVDESATIGTTLGVTGATTLSSTLGVTGATTLSSTLGVTGATTLSSTLAVTGTSTLTGNVTASNDLSVGGNLTVTGNATISGNLTFGDADTDSITLTADVASNIVPDTDDTYDLGTATKQWRNLYIDGTAEVDTLSIDGTAVTSTAAELNILDGVTATAAEINTLDGITATVAELNILDGVTSTATELNIMDGDTAATATTLADADRVVVNDAGVMKQVALTDFETYFESALDTLSNVTTVGALNAGSITSGFGAIDNGSSNITTTGTVTYGSLSDGVITITAFADEDDMVSNSATLVPTQQSVKAYVDAQVTAQDLDLTTDSGTIAIDLDSETLTVAGGTGIDTAASANSVTVAIDSTVATLTDTQTLTNKTLTSPDINTPDIDGGTIDGTVIGGATPAAADFTTMDTTGNASVGGNLSVTGDLTINGTTTTVNSTTVTVDDPIFTLGGDTAPALDDNKDRGIEFRWHNGTAAKVGFFGYDDSASVFTFIPDATNTSEVFSGSAGNVAFGNIAGTLTTAAQTNITSVGTLSSLTVSGDLTVDTDTFYVDSANNRIGIGTTSPNASSVHVDGGGQNSALFLYSNDTDTFITISDDDGAAEIRTKDAGALQFSTGGTTNTLADSTTAMYINSSQNVGIGTTSPSTSLHVRKDQNSSGNTVIIQNEDSGASAAAVLTMDAQGNSFNLITYGDGTSSANVTEFKSVTGSSEFAFSPSSTEKMRIDSSGRVGIGTASPQKELHVVGAAIRLESQDAGGAAAPTLELYRNSASPADGDDIGQIVFKGEDSGGALTNYAGILGEIVDVTGGTEDGRLRFLTATAGGFTEKLRIEESGNVGIGNTSPTRRLVVGDGSGSEVMSIYAGNGSASALHFTDTNTATDYQGFVTYDHVAEGLRFGAAEAEGMRLTSTGLGIGTTSPDMPLTVVGNVSRNAVKIITSGTGTEEGILYWYASDASTIRAGISGNVNGLDFKTGASATQRMRIDSSGNVSIGNTNNFDFRFISEALSTTTTPAKSILVRNGSARTVANQGAQIGFQPNSDFTTGSILGAFINAIETTGAATNAVDLTFGTGSGGSAAERMRIDSSGSLLVGKTSLGIAGDGFEFGGGVLAVTRDGGVPFVANRRTSDGDVISIRKDNTSVGVIGTQSWGIGTTSPFDDYGALLAVADTSGNARIGIVTSTSGTGQLRFGDGTGGGQRYRGFVEYAHSGDSMRFGTSATERMRIDSSGDVGIGITNPVHKLSVAGNNSGYLVKFFNDGGLADRAGLHIQGGADSGAGTTVYLRVDDGDGDFTGELKTVSGVFQLNDVSDERLKQDIVDTSINGLEAVNNMRIVDFAYKKNPSETIQAGFIAQELQEVFAPAVSESTEFEEGAESYLGVSRERLVPVLVKAIQEQQKQIESLKSEIELLKGGQ